MSVSINPRLGFQGNNEHKSVTDSAAGSIALGAAGGAVVAAGVTAAMKPSGALTKEQVDKFVKSDKLNPGATLKKMAAEEGDKALTGAQKGTVTTVRKKLAKDLAEVRSAKNAALAEAAKTTGQEAVQNAAQEVVKDAASKEAKQKLVDTLAQVKEKAAKVEGEGTVSEKIAGKKPTANVKPTEVKKSPVEEAMLAKKKLQRELNKAKDNLESLARNTKKTIKDEAKKKVEELKVQLKNAQAKLNELTGKAKTKVSEVAQNAGKTVAGEAPKVEAAAADVAKKAETITPAKAPVSEAVTKVKTTVKEAVKKAYDDAAKVLGEGTKKYGKNAAIGAGIGAVALLGLHLLKGGKQQEDE